MQARGRHEVAENFMQARGRLDEGKDYPFCRKNKVY